AAEEEARSDESRELRRAPVRSRFLRFFRLLLVAFLALFVGAAGYVWWLDSLNYETTDNAYVKTTLTFISARVSGVVEETMVGDNHAVEAGDLLLRLDRSTYQVAVEKTEAMVSVARSNYESSKISVTYSRDRKNALLDEAKARLATLRQTLRSARSLLAQRRSEASASQANRAKFRDELARMRKLHREKIISDGDLDRALASFKVAEAGYNASRSAWKVEEEKVAGVKQQMKEAQASVALARNEGLDEDIRSEDSKSLLAKLREAEADLKEKRLLLSYTEIRAPVAGYVSKMIAEIGSFVGQGRPLLAIVSLHAAYIEANFKENQLETIRVGQPVTIVADAYPNHPFRGRVGSINPGTGDAFSLLPAENATGNWVKVVRRVPVRIILDEVPSSQFPLLIGMSAEVKVDIRDRSGSHLLAYPGRAQRNNNKDRTTSR
ncbi:MAG: HlyD family secretion protein, partial [bacterium]